MLESREDIYYGIWFLPGSDVKLQGKLTVSENFIDLHLTDPNRYTFVKTDTLDILSYSIIHGMTQHKELITLYDCSGYSSDFSAKFMLYGDEYFSSMESLKFAIMSLNFPLFDKWITHESFKKEIKDDGFLISYTNPTTIEFDLMDDLKLSIDFNCRVPETHNKTKVIINEYSSIQLISLKEEGLLLTKFIKSLLYLQQLLSFLFRDGANVDFIRVYPAQKDYKQKRLMGTMLFGLFPFNKYAHPEIALHPLIKYDLVKDDFHSLVKNWFVFAGAGQHIINLILQDYFYRGAFDENRFLNLIRVLEIYHAFKFPGTKLPQDVFKEKLNEILENIPAQYKNEVRDCLNFSNELNLDMRLRTLIAEINGIPIGFDYTFDDAFIKKVKWSRNYYTHYNSNIKNKALVGEELENLTQFCRALINFLIIKHLGVSEEKLSEAFKFYFENSYYSNYFI
jgi:hypothetical protein